MKIQKIVLVLLVLAGANVAFAAVGDMTNDGLTGLWTFHNNPTYQTARIGTDLVGNGMGTSLTGPWTAIGTQADPLYAYSDGLVVQNQTYNSYLQVTHNIGANGGGLMANEYTIMLDYQQTQAGDNSLFNTLTDDTQTNAAELKYLNVGTSLYQIGSDVTGYSATLSSSAGLWHRLVLSVDNGNFYRVYVDGGLVLDAAGQTIDGDYALGSAFNLFTGNGWNDKWGLCGTVATWDRALTTTEVGDMGGWLGGSATPTALVLTPEPTTLSLMALGGIALLRRNRK